ncbi:MAG: potassium channel protein [Polyangiales bacterium]
MGFRWTRMGTEHRLISAFGFFATVLAAGTIAFYVVGEGGWGWFDCFYMTLVTVSTVGFGETLHGMSEIPEARFVTVMLIVFGSGTLLYFVSSLTAVIVEGDIGGLLRRQRMQKQIDKLSDHIIVCGVGTTGRHIVEELSAAEIAFVAIDLDEERILDLEGDLETTFLHVIGDATDDTTLIRAGIQRANGIIAALNDDKANLFVTISARALNGRARIVAKAIETSTEGKLVRAGANAVVSPNLIGGLRLVSELVRPQTVAFLDKLLRGTSTTEVNIEEIDVPDDSHCVGRTIRSTGLSEHGALLVAMHRPNGEYTFNPSGDALIESGASLIVLANQTDIRRIREAVRSRTPLSP